MRPEPEIHHHFVRSAGVWQYVIADPTTKHAVIIDPVLDQAHDPARGPISTYAADALLEVVRSNNYHIDRILETHALPESLSSAWYLRTQIRERFGYTPRVCIGKSLAFVSRFFARNGVHDSTWTQGFDKTFYDGESFSMGKLLVHVLALPGLSADHVGYQIGKNIFVGDHVFNPITGPENVPKDSVAQVWASFEKLMRQPRDHRIYVGSLDPESGQDARATGAVPQVFSTIDQHHSAGGNRQDILSSGIAL